MLFFSPKSKIYVDVNVKQKINFVEGLQRP